MTTQSSSRREGAALFAADEDEPEHALGEDSADATTQACARPVVLQVVEVGFTDQAAAPVVFGGMRKQYVNLTDKKVRNGDADITSDNQVGRTPPIIVRVSPPQATTVRVRLRRTLHRTGFPTGSSTLSPREQGLTHLSYARSVTTHTTGADGVVIIEPGKRIAALGGGEYKVEASLPGKAWVPGSNSVRIKRRIYIRPVARYAAGIGATITAINAIRADMERLDIEIKVLPRRTGTELGVAMTSDLSPDLKGIGRSALNSSTNHIRDLKPHSLAIICGKFTEEPDWLPVNAFSIDLDRDPGTGRFPDSARVPLVDSARTQYHLIPLNNGTHFESAIVSRGATAFTLDRVNVSGLDDFSKSLTVDLRTAWAAFAGINRVRLTLRVKAIDAWGVGWSYPDAPVIYLNMHDPASNAVLPANSARALVIHELGHSLHLTATNQAGQPDQQPHHYPTFDQNGIKHQGPHCSTGLAPGVNPWDAGAEAAATCTMWGSLTGKLLFCDECKTTLRKVDLEGGF